MNKEELAAKLNRREYTREITKDEEAIAKAHGLVVLFGASDDLMEFRGAIYDEVGCFDGGTAYLTSEGLLQNECDNRECPHFERMKGSAKTIEAVFGEDGYTWIYKTDIPHSTFEILEDEDTYCKGIVFALTEV